jgi:hypothetical protein
MVIIWNDNADFWLKFGVIHGLDSCRPYRYSVNKAVIADASEDDAVSSSWRHSARELEPSP